MKSPLKQLETAEGQVKNARTFLPGLETGNVAGDAVWNDFEPALKALSNASSHARAKEYKLAADAARDAYKEIVRLQTDRTEKGTTSHGNLNTAQREAAEAEQTLREESRKPPPPIPPAWLVDEPPKSG